MTETIRFFGASRVNEDDVWNIVHISNPALQYDVYEECEIIRCKNIQ